jgi:hypothetical protein
MWKATEIGRILKAGCLINLLSYNPLYRCKPDTWPAHLYKEGGYEVESTRFAIGSSDMIVKKALLMLYDL